MALGDTPDPTSSYVNSGRMSVIIRKVANAPIANPSLVSALIPFDP